MIISLIVPVYNTEAYLSGCIDSVLAQSFTDFELILVDDGSTDGSGKICDAYAEKDSRIVVFHKGNGGVSSARNLGLSHARGAWITFVDSDDVLPVDALESYHSAICEGTDLVMTKYRIIDNDLVKDYKKYQGGRTFSQLEFLKLMYTDTGDSYQGYSCSKLFRASVIAEAHLQFNENIYFNEDRLFVVQFACASSKPVVYKDALTYCYYIRPTSAMSSLKKGYNRRLVTDFDALILMKKAIDKQSPDHELKSLAVGAILYSYEWNHKLMMQYGEYDSNNHWHMLCRLFTSGAFAMQIKMSVYPFIMMFFPTFFIKSIPRENAT